METLEKIFPDSQEELATITHAYLRVRYGELPEKRGQIEEVESLEKILPDSQEELATITHAYLRVRYGELPETSGQVDEVESAWERVRKRGRSDDETG